MRNICKKCFIEKVLTYEEQKLYESGGLKIIETDYDIFCDECLTINPVVMATQVIEQNLFHKAQINETYCNYKGSEDVLIFIKNFLEHGNDGKSENILKTQFNEGYCYYFAVILKVAFNRGKVCWCAPYGHICWVDDDGTPYDIYGICISEAEHFIPVSYLGECLNDFLHINKDHCSTEEELQDIINRYLNDKKGEKV